MKRQSSSTPPNVPPPYPQAGPRPRLVHEPRNSVVDNNPARVPHTAVGCQTRGCGDTLVPVGRGSVRGQRSVNFESFKLSRPQSSYGSTGKQGTTGTPTKLITNYFPITSYTNWCLYQYRVDFSSEIDKTGTKKGLLAQHRDSLGGYLFDGTMLFTGLQINTENLKLTSIRRSDDQKIDLYLKFANKVETGDYVYIQVFNLLLRKCLRYLDLKLIGKNFYDPKSKIDILQHKLQLYPGYETSIGQFENNILLNAEITTKVMRQETVLDFLNQCINNRYNQADWMHNFKSNVIGTTIMTTYNNETYRIDDVDEGANPNSEFSKKDGSKMSYLEYYQQKWNLTIRNVSQPMLVTKNKKSARQFGTENVLIYLVPEFCIMTGITEAMRNNFVLMRDMAVHTRVTPVERIRRLTNFANNILSKKECVTEFKQWNLTMSNDLANVSGRVLPPETIQSHSRQYEGGPDADWTRHLRSLPMFTSAAMPNWVILTPMRFVGDVQRFTQNILKAAQGMSFVLPWPQIVPMQEGGSQTLLLCLENAINQFNPTMILCVVQTPRGDVYSLIKRKLCIDRAVPSQVVLLKNVQKNNLSVCTKIAIQINCKIGGAPWHISIPKKGMMILGYDVCHDKQNKNLSYGALVATINDAHTNYYSCVEQHTSGEEISNHFATCISKALLKYKSKNGSFPTSLVIYRDGVGDGQLSLVHKIEVQLLKAACEQFYGPQSVPMAFIIVKKRINTRFFLPGSRGAQNPLPGTVVDSVVTDPTKYDFFLISQNVRQGTVTPTHYNVIVDTLRLPPDIIQRLTFKLTHMYYNCTGTVRVPAHCQLAHKLARLTSQTLRTQPNSGLEELLYFL